MGNDSKLKFIITIMGSFVSRWRKKPSTEEQLEQIQNEITSIEKFKRETINWQKKVIGYLLAYFSALYFIAAAIAYFRYFHHPEWQTLTAQLTLWIPFLIAPFLLMLVKRLLTWWYHRKVERNEKQLSDLIKKRTQILNDVMETETYKKAKAILEKYAPEKLNAPRTTALKPADSKAGRSNAPGPSKTGPADTFRRRVTNTGTSNQRPLKTGPTSPSKTSLNTTLPTKLSTPTSSRQPVPPGSASSIGPPVPARSFSLRTTGSNANQMSSPQVMLNQEKTSGGQLVPRTPGDVAPAAPPGPPLPRPVLQRERGYMDRLVEYLVGDGPSNRYALICKQCQSHNGMALKEEFEYIAYRCCYCYYWNPARKQRPTAPKLQTPMIRQSSTDSTSSEEEQTKTKPPFPKLDESKVPDAADEGKAEKVIQSAPDKLEKESAEKSKMDEATKENESDQAKSESKPQKESQRLTEEEDIMTDDETKSDIEIEKMDVEEAMSDSDKITDDENETKKDK